MNSPTSFLPPQIVFANGTITGTEWSNTSNIFLVDGDFATSNGTSDFTVGNFNTNIPEGSIVNGIEIEIIGKIGAVTVPPISLTVDAYDNTNGADVFYPYTAPITNLTTSLTTVTIGSPTYTFGQTYTVDMINNLKLAFTANGSISLDSVLVKVYFTPPATNTLEYNTLSGTFQVGETITGGTSGATGEIVTDNGTNSMTITNVVGIFLNGEVITGGTSGATATLNAPTPGVCIDCSSPIQVQAMRLALPFLAGESKFYLEKGSFSYPDGRPVQPGDVGSCGGTIPFVFDESKRKSDGGNWEENAMLDTNNGGTWSVLTSGVIEVDLGSVTKRGLDFKYPAGHVAALMSNHDAGSKVIISNNEPYNLTLVRACQAGTLFSAPMAVEDEGISVTTYVKKINFTGAGITASLSSPNEVEVNVPDASISLETDGTPNGDQTLLNLKAGPGVVLTDDGVGGVTIESNGAGITLETDGTPNGDQTLLNLKAGTNITLTDDGVGGVTIDASAGGSKISIDTTQVSVSNATTTAYTVAIPGGTLSTNNGIKYKIMASTFNNASQTFQINIKYGGTTISQLTNSALPVGTSTGAGYIEGYILANTATNAQKGIASMVVEYEVVGAYYATTLAGYGTAAVDSTVSQNLTVQVINGAGDTIVLEGIIVEKII